MQRTEVRKRILAENDEAAARLHERMAAQGTLVLNLLSSPGSGKTTLLEETARRLGGRYRLGALVGDVATELDADRLRAAGLDARQIVTGGGCHLDARQVTDAVDAAGFGPLDLLLIENVGNLVCPASYRLGEDFKVALLSTTEGADKPYKYPAAFTRSAVTVITKIDLLPYLDFDLERARAGVRALNADARILTVSARTGEGMESWCDLCSSAIAERRAAAATA